MPFHRISLCTSSVECFDTHYLCVCVFVCTKLWSNLFISSYKGIPLWCNQLELHCCAANHVGYAKMGKYVLPRYNVTTTTTTSAFTIHMKGIQIECDLMWFDFVVIPSQSHFYILHAICVNHIHAHTPVSQWVREKRKGNMNVSLCFIDSYFK